MSLFEHVPHPRVKDRPGPVKAGDAMPRGSVAARVNTWLALKITNVVGTMWCAYAFAALALVSLPTAIKDGTATLISWIAQTFLQLVLLSIIMVGQAVQSAAADKRGEDTYLDAEAVLHEAQQIQAHLEAQDVVLEGLVSKLEAK